MIFGVLVLAALLIGVLRPADGSCSQAATLSFGGCRWLSSCTLNRPMRLLFAASLVLSCLWETRATAAEEPRSFHRDVTTFGSSGPALTYVVLGDSTAAGVGGHYDLGIAVSTARELGRHAVVRMTNLAVSGARTRDVRVRQLPLAETLRPDLVLLSAGANDVTHLTPVRSVRTDLRAIVEALVAANPGVKIVITGSPDMGSPPRVPWLLRGVAAYRTKQVNRMFREEAARYGLFFAPIAAVTGPLFRRDRSLFAPDRFHPNDRGYATWIPVINDAIAAARMSN